MVEPEEVEGPESVDELGGLEGLDGLEGLVLSGGVEVGPPGVTLGGGVCGWFAPGLLEPGEVLVCARTAPLASVVAARTASAFNRICVMTSPWVEARHQRGRVGRC
jgi:hypothetical protein